MYEPKGSKLKNRDVQIVRRQALFALRLVPTGSVGTCFNSLGVGFVLAKSPQFGFCVGKALSMIGTFEQEIT